MGTELKIISDTGSTFRVGGYGVCFGGADVTGDRFTARTDFWLDKITATPMVLYQHGQDGTMQKTVVGRVVSTKADEFGLWVEAQITAAKKYSDSIRKLVAAGVLGWSSGSVPHLVHRVKSSTAGVTEITSWPIVELSLTPTPAEPRTVGVRELKALAALDPQLMQRIARKAAGGTSLQEDSYEDLQSDLQEAAAQALGVSYVCVSATYPDHVVVCVAAMPTDMADQSDDGDESAYWDFPYTIGSDGEPVLGTPKPVQQAFVAGAAKAPLSTDARNNLSRGQFAYTDAAGTGHLPINDAAHVRAAMARFNQTGFESPDKRKAAARKIVARARALNIDVSPDSAVAMAAKDGGKSMPELPDDAYAFIEAGGTLDDDRKTSPRSYRHYPHHDDTGAVDPDALAVAYGAAKSADEQPEAIAHLALHRMADELGHDHAHESVWSKGAAPAQLVAGLRLMTNALKTAKEQAAMTVLGTDTKSGMRTNPATRERARDIVAELGRTLDGAALVDKGTDEQARVDWYRQQLALLEVG